MSIDKHMIEVSGISVEVVRKSIKNLHLGVYPPEGHVRVATPLALDDNAVRLAVISRLGWIRRQQERMQKQQRESQREFVSGESHYVQGKRYRLRVIEGESPPKVEIMNNTWLCLHVRPGLQKVERQKILEKWYRNMLRTSVSELIAKWKPVIGVEVTECKIKKMKTKWGSCNVEARRIWINLELAKKPISSLEYVVVHEMVHLLERDHSERFIALMDRFLPQWRHYRDLLNSVPLHET